MNILTSTSRKFSLVEKKKNNFSMKIISYVESDELLNFRLFRFQVAGVGWLASKKRGSFNSPNTGIFLN